jgi:hypothetical protein
MLPQVKAKYTARACGAASFATSSKGNQQIAVPMEVSQGEHAGETITWIAVFHETADKNGVTGAERIIQSLQYMGWQGDDLTELMEVSDEQVRELLPSEVEISCDLETYEGKTRLKVQWINQAGAGRFTFKEAATKNDLRSFAAQMKSTVRSVRGAGGSRPANGASNAPTTPKKKDEDLPFASCDIDFEPSPIARVLR